MKMEEKKDGKHMKHELSHSAADLTNAESTYFQNYCKFNPVVLKVWSLEQQCQHYPEIC